MFAPANKASLTGALALLAVTAAHGAELTHSFVNPSFGGNPLNGGYLLSNAASQNNHKVDSSLFKYVSLRDLLEAEAGFSSNEPPQMAVLEVIERGVYSMILEGAMDGLWSFENPALGQRLIEDYKDEKEAKAVPIYNADGELEGFKEVRPVKPAPSGEAVKN
ncbi:curli assembly protein CsgF [Methylomagnum sp.]